MAFVFSIVNQKGGVGKTTTTISLSTALSEMGFRVLLIDCDAQSNASNGLNVQSELTLYDFLYSDSNQKASDFVQKTAWSSLDLIVSDARLSGLEIEWANQEKNTHVLQSKIKPLLSQYDYIFIDCPPSLGLMTVNALVSSSYFMVPLQCEYYALEGLSLLLHTACSIKENLNPHLSLKGILLTMFDSRNRLSHKILEQVQKHFSNKVFQTVIPRNVRLSEAPSHGLPISKYDAKSSGSIAYKNLAIELHQQMKGFKQETAIQLES